MYLNFDFEFTYFAIFFSAKNRWVIYNDAVNLDYDASMVPAEWYGWLHYKTDYIPTAVRISNSGNFFLIFI